MVADTSRDLRDELNDTNVSGVDLRRFLEKLLNRMIKLEDWIEEKQNKPYEED